MPGDDLSVSGSLAFMETLVVVTDANAIAQQDDVDDNNNNKFNEPETGAEAPVFNMSLREMPARRKRSHPGRGTIIEMANYFVIRRANVFYLDIAPVGNSQIQRQKVVLSLSHANLDSSSSSYTKKRTHPSVSCDKKKHTVSKDDNPSPADQPGCSIQVGDFIFVNFSLNAFTTFSTFAR